MSRAMSRDHMIGQSWYTHHEVMSRGVSHDHKIGQSDYNLKVNC